MDGFIPEAQALNMLGNNNLGQDPSSEEYISPLAMSQPALPIQHYDPSGAYSGPRKPPPKKTHGGFCDICQVKLNSFLQSKSHFEGKPHAKKLKAMETKKKSSNSEDGPPCKKQAREEPVTELYCKPCNLTFTSEAHAKHHYLGRNHARVLHGLKPFEPGYYNTTTNKWQRIPPDPRVSAQLLSSEPPTDVDGRPAHQEKPKVRGKFVCELCNCSLTCEQQLQSHLAGSRHAKVLKKQEALQRESEKSGGESDTSSVSETALRCTICDVSFNSVIQRHQHMQSKKHTLKAAKHQLQQAERGEKDANNPQRDQQQPQTQQVHHEEQYDDGKLQYEDEVQYEQHSESGQCQESMSPGAYDDLQNAGYSALTGPCDEDSRDDNS